MTSKLKQKFESWKEMEKEREEKRKHRWIEGFHWEPSRRDYLPQQKQMASAVKKHGAIRQMSASNEFFTDLKASWRQTTPTTWVCTEADHQLSWMVGKSHESVKNELLRRGFKWEWR